jgi:hypothetical protein
MILNLNKKIHGAKHDFFRAGDHLCDFAGKISRAQDFLSCPDFISQSLSRKYAQQSTASTPKTTTVSSQTSPQFPFPNPFHRSPGFRHGASSGIKLQLLFHLCYLIPALQ